MNLREKFEDLYNNILKEYEILGDYIWKFNLQIFELRKIEIQKLFSYFPNDERLQLLRWSLESPKLDIFFPIFLNYSFITLVFSTIENHMMKICDLLSEIKHIPIKSKDLRGSGFERHIKFLERFSGFSRKNIDIWPQISNLEKIRNCIVHAFGFIDRSNDAKAIREMIKNKTYLSKEDRKNLKNDKILSYISIIKVDNEDRLFIGLGYSHVTSYYGKLFFKEIFNKIDFNKLLQRTRLTAGR